MPVIARYKGWAIVIWFGDHAPAHVHIIKDEIVVRVAIENAEVLSIKGKVTSSEIKHLQKFITENKDDLIEEWNNAQS